MSTAQVAINGLARCYSFTQALCDPSVSFYSSTIEYLKEIRDLGAKISVMANEALAKVGQNIPEVKVATIKELSPDSELILEEIRNLKLQVSSIANVSTSQNVVVQVNNSDTLNHSEVKSYQSPGSVVINPIKSSSPLMPSKADRIKRLKNSNPTTKQESFVDKIASRTKSNTNSYVRDFKTVVRDVGSLPLHKFSSDQIHDLSVLCSNYFEVRFARKSKCKFQTQEFKNYLACFIIAYSNAEAKYQSREFLDECFSWVNGLKTEDSKYVMPLPVAQIYFNLINKKTQKPQCFVLRENYDRAKEIWNELWSLGYCTFNNFEHDNLPDKNMTWLDTLLEGKIKEPASYITQKTYEKPSLSKPKHDNTESVRIFNQVLSLWRSLENYEAYNVMNLKIRESVNLDSLDKRQALLSYTESHGFESLKAISEYLNNIKSSYSYVQDAYDSLDAQVRVLSNYCFDSLDILDVISEYANEGE